MINWLFWKKKEVSEIDIQPEPPKEASIYTDLRRALGLFGHTEIDFNKVSSALGFVDIYESSIDEMIESLIIINSFIKNKHHIDNGRYRADYKKSTSLDSFMFIKDGFYRKDTHDRFITMIRLIEEYHDGMNNSHLEPHGVREHNHRQLYHYTSALTELLTVIFDRLAV